MSAANTQREDVTFIAVAGHNGKTTANELTLVRSQVAQKASEQRKFKKVPSSTTRTKQPWHTATSTVLAREEQTADVQALTLRTSLPPGFSTCIAPDTMTTQEFDYFHKRIAANSYFFESTITFINGRPIPDDCYETPLREGMAEGDRIRRMAIHGRIVRNALQGRPFESWGEVYYMLQCLAKDLKTPESELDLNAILGQVSLLVLCEILGRGTNLEVHPAALHRLVKKAGGIKRIPNGNAKSDVIMADSHAALLLDYHPRYVPLSDPILYCVLSHPETNTHGCMLASSPVLLCADFGAAASYNPHVSAESCTILMEAFDSYRIQVARLERGSEPTTEIDYLETQTLDGYHQRFVTRTIAASIHSDDINVPLKAAAAIWSRALILHIPLSAAVNVADIITMFQYMIGLYRILPELFQDTHHNFYWILEKLRNARKAEVRDTHGMGSPKQEEALSHLCLAVLTKGARCSVCAREGG